MRIASLLEAQRLVWGQTLVYLILFLAPHCNAWSTIIKDLDSPPFDQWIVSNRNQVPQYSCTQKVVILGGAWNNYTASKNYTLDDDYTDLQLTFKYYIDG